MSAVDLDAAIRALHQERHEWERCSRLGQPFDKKRLAYVLAWIDTLECAEAYLKGSPWTKDRAPGYPVKEAAS